jgi:hypothetical protein
MHGNENKHKIYEQRVIAFVDILGWREACKTESRQLIKATQTIHNAAGAFSSAIKAEIKKLPNMRINPIYLANQFGAFSDHFATSAPANLAHHVIGGAAEVCLKLLQIGFLTRGAITLGNLHHIDNVIFGPALIEAVQLEKEAVYPRLVCSPKLIDHLKSFPSECDPIIADHLGRQIVNLFVTGMRSTTGQPLNPREIFGIETIEKNIEAQIQQHSIDRADKRAEKWRYMRDILPVMLNSQR